MTRLLRQQLQSPRTFSLCHETFQIASGPAFGLADDLRGDELLGKTAVSSFVNIRSIEGPVIARSTSTWKMVASTASCFVRPAAIYFLIGRGHHGSKWSYGSSHH